MRAGDVSLPQAASETVFVPLTVGGGIREFTDSEGKAYTALDVASEYFRSGADKVSIGSDAVFSAEELIANNNVPTGKSSIEQISYRYGKQAVVVRSRSQCQTLYDIFSAEFLPPLNFCWGESTRRTEHSCFSLFCSAHLCVRALWFLSCWASHTVS